MHIFICKNCGKLTESEDSDVKVCASCGAPLDPLKSDGNEEVLEARRPSAKRPAPIRLPSNQPSNRQRRPAPAPKKPAAPAPKKPAAPASKKPAAPASKKPAAPASKKPAAPASKKPTTPASSQQARPVPLRPVELPKEYSEEARPRPVAGEAPSDTSGEESYVQPQIIPGAETERMEFYVNKDLLVCPQCGYGCDPNWGKCPICEAPIAGSADLKKVTEMEFSADEASFTKGLIPCPKCQYYCDPSWGKCPICNSELKESPEAEKAEPEKPEAKEPESE